MKSAEQWFIEACGKERCEDSWPDTIRAIQSAAAGVPVSQLVWVAEGVMACLQYPRGSEAQVRCLEEVAQDAKRALSEIKST